MPDNPTPREWSADEGFWNDAWQDMEQRLDRRTRRRNSLFWLLPLLLLLTGAGALVHRNLGTARPEPAPATTGFPVPINPVVASGVPASNTYPRMLLAPDEQDRVVNASGPDQLTGSQESRGTDRDLPVSTQEDPHQATGVPNVVAADTERAEASRPVMEDITPATHELAPYYVGASPPIYTLYPGPVSLFPSGSLTFASIRLPLGNENEPPGFSTKPDRWNLGGGINAVSGGWKPGYFAQLSYRLTTGKTFVPLTVRYDRTRRQLALSHEAPIVEFVGQPSINFGGSGGSTVSSLRSDFTGSGIDHLRTTTLELRSGIGRRFGPVALSGGAGVSYLLSGRGPSLVSADTGGGSSVLLGVEERALDFGANNLDLLSDPMADRLPLTQITVDRLDLVGWLQVDYRFRQRYSVALGWTYLATDVYTTDLLSVERNRLELGVGIDF